MTAFPEITKESVDQCSAAYWYPLLSSCTFKSALIPLESDFIDYLGADGLILPLDDNGQPFPNNEFHKEEDTSDVDEDAADADDSSEVEEPIYPEFPDLLPKIKTTIQALGGSVFPKLNWSSPKDASWMALDGTLRCQTPHDILILLKSSDFIVHDLNQAYEFTSDSNTASDQSKFFLFLRKWYDLTPSMEFRCFVRDSSIVAICQRDTRNYYPFLASLESKATKMVQEFLNDKVLDKFSLTNFVMDVYLGKNCTNVWLVDINPFSPVTDSLLFEWEDLLSLPASTTPLYYIIESPSEIHEAHQPKYSSNRLPKEVIDLSNGVMIDDFASQFQRELIGRIT